MISVIAVLMAAVSQPNVVMISVDTLRADYLGCYGYDYATSPHIDALAEQGRLYENCVSEVPLTNPSFSSFHSSRYPRETGAYRNGLRIGEDVPLVAEQFQQAGYQTWCVQSNWTLKDKLSGLARGFDVYDDDFHKKRWGIIKAERYAQEVTDLALDLVANRDPDKPFFAWFHYSDPHAPYKSHHGFTPAGKSSRKLKKRNRVRAKYASEIAFMDHHLGRLLEALPKEDTYILFVADHGESLYEHDYLGHGRRIYQPGTHIPLILVGPGIEPGRSQAPVRGLDVGTTMLGMAGLSPAAGMRGLNLMAHEPPAERVRVIETYGGAVPKLPGARALMASRPPQRQGVYVGPWKLILGGSEPELFLLDNDPGELANQADAEPDRVTEMTRTIGDWDAAHERRQSEEANLKEEDLEALESLGYLD